MKKHSLTVSQKPHKGIAKGVDKHGTWWHYGVAKNVPWAETSMSVAKRFHKHETLWRQAT